MKKKKIDLNEEILNEMEMLNVFGGVSILADDTNSCTIPHYGATCLSNQSCSFSGTNCGCSNTGCGTNSAYCMCMNFVNCTCTYTGSNCACS